MPAACRSEAVSNTIGDVSAYLDGLKARASRGHARLKNFVWTRLIWPLCARNADKFKPPRRATCTWSFRVQSKRRLSFKPPMRSTFHAGWYYTQAARKLGLHNAMRHDPG